jgi:hypothetical protein
MNSEKCDTVPDIDELSTTEEEPMTESESSEKLELDPMNKDTNLIDDTNVMLDSTLNEVADNATPSLPQGIPPPIKRPAEGSEMVFPLEASFIPSSLTTLSGVGEIS